MILAHVLPALAGRLVATVLTVCHMLMAFVQTGHVLTSLSAVSVERDSATLSPGSQCSFCQSTRDELVRLREEVMVLKATVLRLSEAESLRVAKTIPGSNEGSHRPRKRQAKQAGSQSDPVLTRQQAPVPTTRPRNKIPLLGKRKVWGTMKHASAATVSRALTQLTSLASKNIKVKRKFKNGDRAGWWHVISGEENILKILEDEWEGVKRQLGWNILPCLVYSESDVPSAAPLAPLSSSPSQSEPVNKGATSITNSLLPTTAPVLDLSEYVSVSPRVSPVTASSFASNTPSTCPTKTSPSLVHPQVPSTSVAKDPGIAVPPTSNNPGTTLPSTSSSDS